MKAFLIVTIFYVILAGFFYFDKVGGGSFFSDVKSIHSVGETIPRALLIGVAYMWFMLGSIHYLSRTKQSEHTDMGGSQVTKNEDFVAASND
ncbi:hypothetical protein [Halalkalibacter okhensis]|uniref:Uncharacterized protein n=1 Tax=Halalkalibacter okhensis TaxID=333138 RepID=A0A0B0IBP9_9BACI|nr:hypothetical protein [Halalkalibacter okhensis]KHF39993.1 hypothetical protein LQ50_11930 [Halalkalibacter okhensis]